MHLGGLVVSVVALAGLCASAGVGGESAKKEDVTVTDCAIRQGVFPVPYAVAAGRMPPGMQAATYLEPYGAPRQVPPATGEVDVGFVTCRQAWLGGKGLGKVSFVLVAVMASGPVGTDPATQHFGVAVGGFYDGNALQHVHKAWGFSQAEAGEVSSAAALAGLAVVDEADAQAGSLLARLAPAAQPVPFAAESYHFTFAEDGQVTGGMTFAVEAHGTRFGPASLDVEPQQGSWLSGLPDARGIGGAVSEPGWDWVMTADA